MAFGTAQSMPGSQQDSYQGSTIWSYGKATLRKRIPGSLHWQSSTFEGLSPSTIRTIQRSRQQPPSPSIRLRQWLGYPLHSGQQPSPRRLQNQADLLGLQRPQRRNVADLLGPPPPPPSEQRSPRPLSCLILFRFSSLASYQVRRFFTNHTSWIFRFSSSVSHWVRRFFIDRSRIFLIVPLGARSMILRNPVFPPHLPTRRQEVFSPIPQNKYQTTLIDDTLNGAHA